MLLKEIKKKIQNAVKDAMAFDDYVSKYLDKSCKVINDGNI